MESENIKFFLCETKKIDNVSCYPQDNTIIDLPELINNSIYPEEYDIEQLVLYYKDFNVKKITQILQYYKIHKSKMIKDEMIQVLLFFETDHNNHTIVSHRLRLWQNIQELKDEPFFSRKILF